MWNLNFGVFSLAASTKTLFDRWDMLTSSFYACRSQKRKKTVKSSAEKKLTNLLCYCISADLHFMLCAQVWWNWPGQHPPNVCQNLPINPGTAIEVCVTPSIQNLKLAINASLLFVYTGQSWFQSKKVFYNCTLDTFTWDVFFFFFFTFTSS